MGDQDITRDDLLREIARSMIPPSAEDGWFTAGDVWDEYQKLGNPDGVKREAFMERVNTKAEAEGWETLKFGRDKYYRMVKR